jgi:hypothetical protein
MVGFKGHKGRILEVIDGSAFSASQFDVRLSEEKHEAIDVLLRGTRYYFSISVREKYLGVEASPPYQSTRHQNFIGTWPELEEEMYRWLAALKRAVNGDAAAVATPEAWMVLDLAATPSVNNAPFSGLELQGVWKALGAIQETLLKETHENDAHRALVEAELARLRQSSETVGRKDWLLIAIGALVNLGVGLSLPPDTLADVFGYLKVAMRNAVLRLEK